MYSIHVYTLEKPVKRFRVGELTPLSKDIANIINGRFFFSNLQIFLNLILKFRATHYFKSVIRIIIIEYNKFCQKTHFQQKKKKKNVFFFLRKKPSPMG